MLRDEYVTRFDAIAAVKRAEAHDGTVDDDELLRFGADGSPAVLVAQVGLHDTERVGGTLRGVGLFGAYVIVGHGDEQLAPNASPGDLAMTIAQLMVAELLGGAAFASELGPAEKVNAQNFVSPDLSRMGFAMWVVTWSQREAIDATALAGVADTLRQIRAEYDIAPTVGTDLTDDIT